MKRYVAVPAAGNDMDNPPEEALSLAKNLHLSIVFKDDVSVVSVVAEPEVSSVEFPQNASIGRLMPIDCTNEFVDFSRDVCCVIFAPGDSFIVISPKIREKHLVRFRYRPSALGAHRFAIKNCSAETAEHDVVVFDCETLADGEFYVGSK